MIDARRVAVSGFGYGALAVATLGLLGIDEALTQLPSGRRIFHDGLAFNIDEDDEEILMLLAAVAPQLNRRH